MIDGGGLMVVQHAVIVAQDGGLVHQEVLVLLHHALVGCRNLLGDTPGLQRHGSDKDQSGEHEDKSDTEDDDGETIKHRTPLHR